MKSLLHQNFLQLSEILTINLFQWKQMFLRIRQYWVSKYVKQTALLSRLKIPDKSNAVSSQDLSCL